MKTLKLVTRIIGADFPPLVIAEKGNNHQGSSKPTKDMVNAAFYIGAEVVNKSDGELLELIL